MNLILKNKNLRKKSKVLYGKDILISDKISFITHHHHSLFIIKFPYSDPSFQGNRERASTSFRQENRLPLCDHKNET